MKTNSAISAGKDELLACLEIGKLLTSTTDLKEILEHIVTKGSQLIKADHWSLLLKDEETGKLSFVIVTGVDMKYFENIHLGPNEGIAPRVAQTGIPMFIPDVTKEPLFNKNVDEKTGFTTRSLACIPLTSRGIVSGVIEIINIEDMDFFGQKEFPILRILTDYAAIAIENARQFSKIEKLNITDEYTGLYNARYLHKILDRFFDTCDSTDKISAVFIDIDDFKEIVDAYGHLAGSDVLRQIGVTISNTLSDDEMLIKYGGDEYVIILPGKDSDAAYKESMKVSAAINAENYSASKTDTVKVSASFGIASYPDLAKNKTELLIAADNALFDIKNTSKNSVGIAQNHV